LKHIDNVTENYDSNNDGTAKGYVDTADGWHVFVGDNTDTSNGHDEPIAVIKTYGTDNGFSYYAYMPYNYTVVADFQVPQDSEYGNFYIFPRYANVDFKYEVSVDTQYNTLVFNVVVNGEWTNLATVSIPFSMEKGKWYTLKVDVSWEYNSDNRKYMNHFIATVTDEDDPSNAFTAEFWDDLLSPSSYNGLAFLGFDSGNQFKVYMDNVLVTSTLEKVGKEANESSSITPPDMDITSISITNDPESIIIKTYLQGRIGEDQTNVKYWNIEMILTRTAPQQDGMLSTK